MDHYISKESKIKRLETLISRNNADMEENKKKSKFFRNLITENLMMNAKYKNQLEDLRKQK